jgi:argininosuccinate lyase
LVKKGLPFRTAHEIIGKMVLYCIQNNKTIDELSMEEFNKFSPAISHDVYREISLQKCVSERKLPGGPAKESILQSIQKARTFISKYKSNTP